MARRNCLVCLVRICVMYIDVYWVQIWVAAFLLKTSHLVQAQKYERNVICTSKITGLYRHISVCIVEFLSGVLSGARQIFTKSMQLIEPRIFCGSSEFVPKVIVFLKDTICRAEKFITNCLQCSGRNKWSD